ncbi:50S ribosomal protein L21 [Pseudogemmobacter sp. W21_MBD1_M6]|uniref:50S ribosomal protein L21 n=1 Tax=Pseudogemmobacter sp. W21_MBD1_M6 TaxID=3240271 RepID=UPI003F9B8A24
MFAVLKTGGKQYKVQSGDVLRVEKLAAAAGEKIQFNEILMLGGDSLVVGAPLVADAGVQAEVIDQIKGEKVIHYVKRRRKHSSQRTKGHRQQLSLIRVTDILATGADKSGVKAALGAGSVTPAAMAAMIEAGTPLSQKPAKNTDAVKKIAVKKAAAKAAAAPAKATRAKAAKAETADAADAPKKKPAAKKAAKAKTEE